MWYWYVRFRCVWFTVDVLLLTYIADMIIIDFDSYLIIFQPGTCENVQRS